MTFLGGAAGTQTGHAGRSRKTTTETAEALGAFALARDGRGGRGT